MVRETSDPTQPLSLSPATGRPKSCPRDTVLISGSDIECRDYFSYVALCLFRFIGAAYATGVCDCWEAAYRYAEEAPGVRDSALLVARTAALVRILRRSRECGLAYMPPCCNRLSKDEIQLMGLLEAARRGASGELEVITSGLVDAGQEAATIQAVNALAALSTGRPVPRHAVHSVELPRKSRGEPSFKRAV